MRDVQVRRAVRASPRSVLFLFVVMAMVLFAPVPSAAQSGDREQMSRHEMQRRVIQGFERRLVRELNLDSGQLEEVQAVIRSMRHERVALYQRRRALDEQTKRFGDGAGSEAEARAILSEARAIRAEEARIEAEEEALLLEILSPSQVVQFGILRDDLNDRIRRMHSGGGPPDF
ncbi:MAG: hypothetical protein WD960_06320 [Gemmatimonadota bacterium]